MKVYVKYLTVLITFFITSTAFSSQDLSQIMEIYFGDPDSSQDVIQLRRIPFHAESMKYNIEAQLAPAPSLSYLQISYVGSSNYGGWETISSSQISTVYDHGGTQLRVITDEIGYGNIPVARINGGALPSTANYQTAYICQSGSSYVTPCSSGQIIVGYRKYWKLDGYQSGIFAYQNTSTNSPWNTLSDSISIK